MFRMVAETVRILLLGNAGGAALIIGFMSSSTIQIAETPVDLDGWILDFQEGSNSGNDYIRLTNFED